MKASSLQEVEEIREVEGHWDLFKEVVDKKLGNTAEVPESSNQSKTEEDQT